MSTIITHFAEYWLVHLLLALYTLVLAYHAWTGHRATRDLRDYYVGGRTMGGVVIGLSFFATYSSTNSFVGFSGQAYSWGLPWLLLVPFVVGMSFLAWVCLAPRLRRFTESLDSVTIPDFIGFRFGSNVARVSAAAIVLFASFFYMTAVFKGIGNLLETFLHLPYPVAIVIVFLIVMVYTALGGFISVVRTDALQGGVMILAAALLFSGVSRAAGGLDSVLAVRHQPGGAELFSWNGGVPFPLLLGFVFAGTIKFIVEPRQLSRFYALKNPSALRTGVWISTGAFALVYTLLVPIGLYARRIFPQGITDIDLVVPRLLATEGVFSEGVSAFLLLAMVAAAMSSLDSVLLVMAATAQRDLWGVLWQPSTDRSALRATRLWVAVFAFITMLIALDPPGGIVALTALSGSLYAGCFLPPMILGLYWYRGNGLSVTVSFAAGLLVLFLWEYLPFGSTVHEVFPSVVFSLLLYLLLSWLTAPYTTPTLKQLFSRQV